MKESHICVKQKNWNRNKNLSRYNLSINDYKEMLVKQNYCCATCETHISNIEKAKEYLIKWAK